MKRRRTIRFRWTALLLAALMVGLPALGIGREIQQRQRDRALMEAVKSQQTLLAIDLLKQGADANVRDLHEAPLTFLEILRRWWQRRPLQNPSSTDAPSALMLAVQHNDTSLARALLAHGAKDVNATIEEEYRGVHWKAPLLWIAALRN